MSSFNLTRDGEEIVGAVFNADRLAPSIGAAQYHGESIREETRADNKARELYQRELKAKFPFAIKDIDVYLLAEIDGLQEAYMVKRSADFLQVSRDCDARLSISDYGPWLELTKCVPLRKVKSAGMMRKMCIFVPLDKDGQYSDWMEYKDVNHPPAFKDLSSQPEENIEDPTRHPLSNSLAFDPSGISEEPNDDADDLMDSLEGKDAYDFMDNASDLSQQSTLVGGGAEDVGLEGLLRDEIASPTPPFTKRKQMLSSKPPPESPDFFTPSPSRRSSGLVLKCKRCGAKRSTPWPADNRCERCNLKQHNNNATKPPYDPASA